MREDINYYKAKKRVEKIKGFYGHLFSYIVINLVLYLVNYITYPNDFWFDHWFYWQLLLWGIGLVIHGIVVFYSLPIFGKEWEERKVQEFMQDEKQQNNKLE
ncbi:2TM domain-containing protein [Flavobacterium sp. J27]|uniref:2TM domain-containing protein n=1 Tax=Flavobacterium sp. J27 TaxID=2060419 RepID=UPI001031EC5D|nr:2TM domain-containing protein [Flavobacterium sp. J27]